MKSFACVLSLVALVGGLAIGQCSVLPVNTAGGNGQNGYMFNVENISAGTLTITGFDVFGLNAGATVFEIYKLNVTGSYLANAANLTTAANWTLLGSTPLAIATTITPVPILLNVAIPSNTIQAFYLTCQTSGNVSYTSGSAAPLVLGGIIASDANLRVYGGNGKSYPFGSTFGGTVLGSGGRLFRGAVRYQVSTTGSWETNSPAASLNANGAQGTACGNAVTSLCAGAPVAINVGSTNVGLGWDIAVTLSNAVPFGGGGLPTPGGQLVNINLADPSLFFFDGLAFPPFPGPFALNFAMPVLPALAAQLIVLDPTHPDFFQLSQPIELHGLAPSASIPGPSGDDAAVTITAGTAPLCAAPLSFYGTTYTQVNVVTNGRVTFGAPNTSTTAFTALNPMTGDAPYAAAGFCDLSAAASGSGSIVINNVPGGLRVDYNGVPFLGQTTPAVTARINLSVTGDVLIDNNGSAIALAAGSANQAFGINSGNAAIATGVPAAPWAPSTTYTAASPLDCIGTFGLAGSALTANVLGVQFTWTAGGYVLNVF